jgi:hypothetical protein
MAGLCALALPLAMLLRGALRRRMQRPLYPM